MRTTEGNLNLEQQTSLLTHQEQPVEGLILAPTAPLDSSYSSVEESRALEGKSCPSTDRCGHRLCHCSRPVFAIRRIALL